MASLINDELWILLAGTIIFILSSPIVLNSISLVQNVWFGDEERAKATAIAGLTSPLGSLTGLVLSGALSAGAEVTDQSDC